MSRSAPEWVGTNDDAAIPKRVRLRVFDRWNGHCAKCTRKLLSGQWECDHIIPLIAGGRHAESNLQPLCTSPCHSDKTAADVADKALVYRKRAKHVGLTGTRKKIQSRGFLESPPQRRASTPPNKWRGF